MRAVIIGTDFMKDTDGTFKALETNTNIQLDTQWSLNFDSSSFENFVLSNNFTEVVLISNENNTSSEVSYTINYDIDELRSINKNNTDNSIPIKPFSFTFNKYLQSFLTGSNITLTTITTDTTSTTIPFVENTDDKLIIRLSFDTTALIDDNYARDNWGFLKLMYDADNNSIPKCYIDDTEFGIDNIGDTLRDNGNHPNYCIKKRVTPSDNKIYPILLKVSTIEEFNDLKSNLEVDEYIQEYIFNTDDLFDNRLKSYRSVDMLYGSNLDIIHLQVIEKTKNLPILDSADFDDNNQVQPWDRMRYLQKFYTSFNQIGLKLSATENTKVILPDGTIELVTDLQIGDEVKSILFPTLPDESDMDNLENWSSSYDSVITNYQISSSFLENKSTTDYYGVLVTFETDTNSTFSDVSHAKIMVKDGDDVKFERYSELTNGNEIIIFDTTTNELTTTTITNVNFRFDKFTAYTLDFEELDLFLTLEETENQSRYGLVTHNYNYDCQFTSCALFGSGTVYLRYYSCAGGLQIEISSIQSDTPFVCARRFPGTWIGTTCFQPNGGIGPGGLTFSSFCNNQKSDILYKENLNLIGKSNDGLNIYEFNYKNENGLYQGVIAQELIGTDFENALSLNIDGLYQVDYNKIDVEFKKLN
jgi:hypothetical protein